MKEIKRAEHRCCGSKGACKPLFGVEIDSHKQAYTERLLANSSTKSFEMSSRVSWRTMQINAVQWTVKRRSQTQFRRPKRELQWGIFRRALASSMVDKHLPSVEIIFHGQNLRSNESISVLVDAFKISSRDDNIILGIAASRTVRRSERYIAASA